MKNYIDKHAPTYNIHGHQHIDRITRLVNGTAVIAIYGASILHYETGKTIKIL